MHLLSLLGDSIVNFLFPKNLEIARLERLSPLELLDILPPAENIDNKSTLALFDYKDPMVKEIVWEIKFKGNIEIADKLGAILFDHLEHEVCERRLFESANWRMDKPILVPIPVSDKRRMERGWNQAEMLCERISAHDNEKMFKYLPGQLIKSHHTESQTKTGSRNERLRNLTNSMKIRDPALVEGMCVIVIDDVTTTGATFAEARRALYDAGAKKILCVAISH